MGKIDVAKGHVLHKKGETVTDFAIILKGSFILKDEGDILLHADNGSILGAFDIYQGKYTYDYIANEDCTLMVYEYRHEADLTGAINEISSVAPAMASATIKLINGMIDTLSELYNNGCALCSKLKEDYIDYQNTCAELMIMPEKYDAVTSMPAPKKPNILSSWQVELCRSYQKNNEHLRKEYYPLDINFCIGTILLAAKLAKEIQPQIDESSTLIQYTKTNADSFIKEYHSKKAQLDDAKRQEAIAAGSGNLPQIKNALQTILAFADIDHKIGDTFRKDIKRFMACPDKSEKSAEMRSLRQSITINFYAIYKAAFFRSMQTSNIPAEVKMFFLFGFVDEELAGAENTASLYKYALLWKDDEQGTIIPVYNWLKKIYKGDVPPSKDEFDNDWSDHLREEARLGNITQEEADRLRIDTTAMVNFEIENMFTSANKMTYGSIFDFVPTFHAGAINRPLDVCLANVEKVRNAIDRIRSIDYGCFYRQTYTGFPELKINRYAYDIEILPYVILLPNFGSRGIMWQEIEGRVRTTPAHLMLSIFHSENIDNTMVSICAQFRWEMCKRIQGVHYSDISDPSLTSEYCNYLQFYKKNSSLSPDMKDRVKTILKRYGNNYRSVFAYEYELYVNSESNGLPKLNKVAREILFKYCTFTRKYRDILSINPQYRPLMDAWRIRQDEKEHTLDIFSRQILTMTDSLPKEVQLEAEYIKL
ncbi:MAG: hypothetical protein K6C05_07470 [Anaerovibrio sp.]|uniref:hypothetical protein n=1 Tax=Anaerovibrio sp. TaxID=1872532 RepID=UPI0025EB2A44|nr:hypothetical protein [Anaerovibrio sp.]MCR5176678.1 hypothetical protein [Anaerovibrio sp.]